MNSSRIAEDTIVHIRNTVDNFLDIGVAVMDDYDQFYPPLIMKRLLKAVAKEHKLLFIHAIRTAQPLLYNAPKVQRVYLHIPKRMKSQVLVSGLNLIAVHHYGSKYTAARAAAPVWCLSNTSAWEYNFMDTGLEVFDNWLEQCRTNRVFRVALRLP